MSRIILASVRGTTLADRQCAVVRTCPRPIPGWKWNPGLQLLAPPADLFRDTQRWKAAGEWPTDLRWDEYLVRYIQHLDTPGPQRVVQFLLQHLEQGETIALGCWCVHCDRCHRRILGEMLSTDHHVEVEFDWAAHSPDWRLR